MRCKKITAVLSTAVATRRAWIKCGIGGEGHGAVMAYWSLVTACEGA